MRVPTAPRADGLAVEDPRSRGRYRDVRGFQGSVRWRGQQAGRKRPADARPVAVGRRRSRRAHARAGTASPPVTRRLVTARGERPKRKANTDRKRCLSANSTAARASTRRSRKPSPPRRKATGSWSVRATTKSPSSQTIRRRLRRRPRARRHPDHHTGPAHPRNEPQHGDDRRHEARHAGVRLRRIRPELRPQGRRSVAGQQRRRRLQGSRRGPSELLDLQLPRLQPRRRLGLVRRRRLVGQTGDRLLVGRIPQLDLDLLGRHRQTLR